MIGRDSASTLSDRELIRVRGGLRLHRTSSITVGYEHSRHQTLDTRSDRKDRVEVWPNVDLSVTGVVPPAFLSAVVRRLSLTAGYRRRFRTLQFGAGARQNRSREDRVSPLSLTLAFPRGFALAYGGRREDSRSPDPTGSTETRKNHHSVSASAMFRSPLAAFRRRGAPLRISLSLTYDDEVRCRIQSVAGPCVAFIDQLDRRASVSVDSTVRDYQLGVRLHYLDRRAFVGQRAGQTRLQLDIFGEFVLTSDLLGR